MKSLLPLLFVSLSLIACQEQENSSATTEKKESQITSVVTASGPNSVAINSTGSVNITHQDNSVAVNSTGSVTIKDDDNSSRVTNNNENTSIVSNNNIIINTQNGITTQVNNGVSLQPSGKTIRIPISSRTNYTFNNFFDIEQSCGRETYLEIDDAIAPYIDRNSLKIGVIKMISGSYNTKGKIEAKLFTAPLLSAQTNGTGDVDFGCVNKNSFSLVDNSVGDKYLSAIQTQIFNLEFNGVGNTLFDNINIGDLNIEKNSVGDLNITGHIENLDITNNGVGKTIIEQAKNSKISNFGVGSIKVKSDTNILKINSQGLGNVVIHNN